jgi:hypothetical protein
MQAALKVFSRLPSPKEHQVCPCPTEKAPDLFWRPDLPVGRQWIGWILSAQTHAAFLDPPGSGRANSGIVPLLDRDSTSSCKVVDLSMVSKGEIAFYQNMLGQCSHLLNH